MIRIPVSTPSLAYEALIGLGVLEDSGACLRPIIGNRRALVVTSPPIRRRWAKPLLGSLAKAGVACDLLEMPDGEPAKRLSTLEGLAESWRPYRMWVCVCLRRMGGEGASMTHSRASG